MLKDEPFVGGICVFAVFAICVFATNTLLLITCWIGVVFAGWDIIIVFCTIVENALSKCKMFLCAWLPRNMWMWLDKTL